MTKPIPKKRKKSKPIPDRNRVPIEMKKASEVRKRIAVVAYNAQDTATKNVIDGIKDRSVGIIANPEHPLSDTTLLYVATEIVKDLALLDVRVENYEFPKSHCADCQALLIPRKKKK